MRRSAAQPSSSPIPASVSTGKSLCALPYRLTNGKRIIFVHRCSTTLTGAADRATPLKENNMKNFKIASTLIAALMLTSVVGCATNSKTESVGQYVDDSVITTGVKAAILNDPALKVSEINVETYKGVVQLSGFVAAQDSIAKAAAAARTVKGVQSVKNDIRLK
jgi:osmotically-inducible protein OsmY